MLLTLEKIEEIKNEFAKDGFQATDEFISHFFEPDIELFEKIIDKLLQEET